MFSFILVLIEKRKDLLIHINFGVTFFFFFFLFTFSLKRSGNILHSCWTQPSDTVYPVKIWFWFIFSTGCRPNYLSSFLSFPFYSSSSHSCDSISYFIYVSIKVVFDGVHSLLCLIQNRLSLSYCSVLILQFPGNRVSVIMSRQHTANMPGKINQVQLFQEVSTQVWW